MALVQLFDSWEGAHMRGKLVVLFAACAHGVIFGRIIEYVLFGLSGPLVLFVGAIHSPCRHPNGHLAMPWWVVLFMLLIAAVPVLVAAVVQSRVHAVSTSVVISVLASMTIYTVLLAVDQWGAKWLFAQIPLMIIWFSPMAFTLSLATIKIARQLTEILCKWRQSAAS